MVIPYQTTKFKSTNINLFCNGDLIGAQLPNLIPIHIPGFMVHAHTCNKCANSDLLHTINSQLMLIIGLINLPLVGGYYPDPPQTY